MGNIYFSHHFKDYAKFILENCSLLHEQISHLSPGVYKLGIYEEWESKRKGPEPKDHEQQKHMFQLNCQEFLTSAVKGKAEEEVYSSFKKRKKDSFKSIAEKSSNVLQLLRFHNLQKELLLELLPAYTGDVKIATSISLELTKFNNYLTEVGFQTYEDIKKEEIFQEKELISSVIDNTVNGVLAYDTSLKLTEANAVICDLLKLKRSEIIGKHIFDVFPFYKDTDIGLAVKSVLTGVQVFVSERPFVMRKGYYEANFNPLNDSEGKITGGILIVHETTHRKKAEDALKQKNQELIEQQKTHKEVSGFLEQVMETVPCLIFLYDIRKNRNIYTNEKLIKLIGYSPEEVKSLGSELINQVIIHEDVGGIFTDKDFSRFEVFKNLKPNEFVDFSFKVKHKNGSLRWLRTKSKGFLFDKEGNPLQILGIAEDVTELKESEEKVIKARDYYLKILEDFPVLVWRSGKEGEADFFNNSWLQFRGQTIEHELKASWAEMIHPDDLADFLQIYKESFANRQPFKREYRLKQYDGTYRYLIDSGKPVYDIDGEFTGYIGACLDIQDRKDNETLIQKKNKELATVIEELKATQSNLTFSNIELEKRVKERTVNLVAREELIRTITDALPVLITYVDKDLKCKFINKAIERYTGRPRKDIINKPIRDLMKEESFQVLKPEIEKVFEGQARRFEFYTDHQFFGKMFFSIDLIPDETRKEVIGFYGLLFNITDQKKATQTMERLYEEASERNKSLNRINTVLDNFVYTASHDLKSPVINLEGLLQLLKETKDSKHYQEEEEAQIVAMLSLSVNRLRKTIDDLINVTKHQQESELPNNEKVSFKDVFQSVKSDLENQIRESGADIRENFEVAEIFYPESHLRSIFYNLLSNALKYRQAKVPLVIHVETLTEKGFIFLRVADNGMGMSSDKLQQLFKPFNRLHTHVEGTGIGLYSMKRLIEINGGKVKVSSVPAEGTEFNIFFNAQ